jgi:hypothetical protein
MKLYTMPLYTKLEILEMVPHEILMRREQQFLDRVRYVKDDPATGEPLYEILPEQPPSPWATAILWGVVVLAIFAYVIFDFLNR